MIPQQDLNIEVENPTKGVAWTFEEKIISVLRKFLITSAEMFALCKG